MCHVFQLDQPMSCPQRDPAVSVSLAISLSTTQASQLIFNWVSKRKSFLLNCTVTWQVFPNPEEIRIWTPALSKTATLAFSFLFLRG